MFYITIVLLLIETVFINGSPVSLNLTEGAKCSYDQFNGTCVKQYKCLSALNIEGLRTRIPPFCNPTGEDPVVCCPDCELVYDTRNAIRLRNAGIKFKKGTSAHDQCLHYLETLPYDCKVCQIVFVYMEWIERKKCMDKDLMMTMCEIGGENAKRYEYPHMALLGYGDDLSSVQWLCGGSIISEKFILTAAHCISTPKLGNVSFIAVGMLKRSDPPEFWQHYKVKKIFPYPEYNPPSIYHDIALLEMESPFNFSRAVLPACLDTSDYVFERPDKWLRATGWGDLGHGRPPADILQTVLLQEYTEEECRTLYPTHRLMEYGYDQVTQMCYGSHYEIKDTCQGDSGGPLQQTVHENCQFEIRGVTSSGNSCGQMGGAGLYTRIEYYIPWIEDIVWPKNTEIDPELLNWLKNI